MWTSRRSMAGAEWPCATERSGVDGDAASLARAQICSVAPNCGVRPGGWSWRLSCCARITLSERRPEHLQVSAWRELSSWPSASSTALPPVPVAR